MEQVESLALTHILGWSVAFSLTPALSRWERESAHGLLAHPHALSRPNAPGPAPSPSGRGLG